MARTLGKLGHRRIGVISGPANLTTTHDRLAGFRLGLGDLGLELDAAAMVTGDFTRDGGEAAGPGLPSSTPHLTPTLALHDVMPIRAPAGPPPLDPQARGHPSL